MWNQTLTSENRQDFFTFIKKTMTSIGDIPLVIDYVVQHLPYHESIEVLKCWKQPERAAYALESWGLHWIHSGCLHFEELKNDSFFQYHINGILRYDVANQAPDAVYHYLLDQQEEKSNLLLSRYIKRSEEHLLRYKSDIPKEHPAFKAYVTIDPTTYLTNLWCDMCQNSYQLKNKVERLLSFTREHPSLLSQIFNNNMIDVLLKNMEFSNFFEFNIHRIMKAVLKERSDLVPYYYDSIRTLKKDMKFAVLHYPPFLADLNHASYFTYAELNRFIEEWKSELSNKPFIHTLYSINIKEMYTLIDKFKKYNIESDFKFISNSRHPFYDTFLVSFMMDYKQWPVLEVLHPDIYHTLKQILQTNHNFRLLIQDIHKNLGVKRLKMLQAYNTTYFLLQPDLLKKVVNQIMDINKSQTYGYHVGEILYNTTRDNIERYQSLLDFSHTLNTEPEEETLFI